MGQCRNTTTSRRCPECKGAGGFDVDHPSRDPQLETFANCATCYGDGWIRFTYFDALETLAVERRSLLLLRDHPSDLIRNSARNYYRRAKAAAFKPVSLPADRLPSLPDLYAELESAIAQYRRNAETLRGLMFEARARLAA